MILSFNLQKEYCVLFFFYKLHRSCFKGSLKLIVFQTYQVIKTDLQLLFISQDFAYIQTHKPPEITGRTTLFTYCICASALQSLRTQQNIKLYQQVKNVGNLQFASLFARKILINSLQQGQILSYTVVVKVLIFNDLYGCILSRGILTACFFACVLCLSWFLTPQWLLFRLHNIH